MRRRSRQPAKQTKAAAPFQPTEAATHIPATCPHCDLTQMGTWTTQGTLIECPCGKTSLRQRRDEPTAEDRPRSSQSELEESFRAQLVNLGLEGLFYQQYEFHPTRKFKADFAIPSRAILIDLEGGVWTGGRHTRGKGYTDDLARSNMAQLLGWTHLRYTVKEVKDGSAAVQVYNEISRRTRSE